MDGVVDHLRGMILRGEVRRGERLPPERELVRATGVSRVSVRAALQTLVAKGVLVTRHGTGTFVADGPPVLDSQPLSFLAALHGFTRREMFEARQTLEVDVAGMAAERASGHDLAAIADEVTGLFASLDDPPKFLTHDICFHRAVAVASGNPILLSLVDMVSSLFYERRRNTANPPRDLRPVAEMHRQIYQAIRERDRARSEQLMSEHLRIAEQDQVVVAALDIGLEAAARRHPVPADTPDRAHPGPNTRRLKSIALEPMEQVERVERMAKLTRTASH